MSAAKIIKALSEATNFRGLTDAQLESLSCGEEIGSQLRYLATVATGIGCLVAGDDERRVGNFQNAHDVPDLLWLFAESIGALGEASIVSSEAAYVLMHRARGTSPECYDPSTKETEAQS